MADTITIQLNGEAHDCPPSVSVAELLSRLGVTGAKVAVERNLAIVPKSAYDATRLTSGDVIEIVQFVGGG